MEAELDLDLEDLLPGYAPTSSSRQVLQEAPAKGCPCLGRLLPLNPSVLSSSDKLKAKKFQAAFTSAPREPRVSLSMTQRPEAPYFPSLSIK